MVNLVPTAPFVPPPRLPDALCAYIVACKAEHPPCEGDDLVDVRTVLTDVTDNHITFTTLLGLILNGTLRGIRDSDHVFRLDGLLIDPQELRTYLAIRDAGEQWMHGEEISQRFGVPRFTVGSWVRAGWLTPVAQLHIRGSYFVRGTVEQFFADNLTRAAMIQQLGIPELRIRSWVRDGQLHPRQHPAVVG